MNKSKSVRKSIRDNVLETAEGLAKIGVMDAITLRELEALCIPEVKAYSPKAIARLRKSLKLSQTAFARVLNTSVSTIQKWESGAKKPSGMALKLLNIAERKGYDALL